MKFLFLILAVAPVLGTEFHSRERRQAQHAQPNYQAYNRAPAAIQQILAAQQYREPIVHLPPQQIPNLTPSRPIEPQHLNQAQLSSYQPKVQIGQAPQQPTYKQINVRPAPYNPPTAARQQYNPQPAPQPQYNSQPAPQPQYNPQPAAQTYNPQYRTNYAPAPQQQLQPQPLQQQQAAQPNYQYSRNLPPQLQQLVQLQLDLSNAIPQGGQTPLHLQG